MTFTDDDYRVYLQRLKTLGLYSGSQPNYAQLNTPKDVNPRG